MLAQPTPQWAPFPSSASSASTHSAASSATSPRFTLLSTTSSLSSTFSDIGHSPSAPPALSLPEPPSSGSSKTHAFFASPFSPSTSLAPSPSIAPIPVLHAEPPTPPKSTKNLTADFFASPPSSAQPTPPPSLHTRSRDPSPSPAPISAPPVERDSAKPRLPPLARFFPSRYNSDPSFARKSTIHDVDPTGFVPVQTRVGRRGFLELDLDLEDATPVPLSQRDYYFDNHPELKRSKSNSSIEAVEDDEVSNPETESTTSPTTESSDFSHQIQLNGLPMPQTPVEILGAGDLIADHRPEGKKEYRLVKALGRGAFSNVWLARPDEVVVGGEREGEDKGKVVAIKLTPKSDPINRLSFEREAEILRHVKHLALLPLIHTLSTSTHLALVLPFAQGGDLLDLVNSDERHAQFGEGALRRIVRELVGAVGWLHSNDVGVVHRDVKLENILLTAPNFPTGPLPPPTQPLIKLSDFGLSRFLSPPSSPPPTKPVLLSIRCGSEAYAAPELVLGSGRREEGWYDGRGTDAWAVGVVVYALVGRGLPFGEGVPSASEDEEVVGRGRQNGYAFAYRRERRESERKSWLGKIARGEWVWPSEPSSSPGAEGELRGPYLPLSVGARSIVERLLVRDPKKRARLEELREDGWLAGEEGWGGWEWDGEVIDREGVGRVAWKEIES